jgi:RNA-binding protein
MEGKAELRKKARSLDILIRIGKNGLRDSVIDEIIKQLKKKRLIKIKLLKSYVDLHDRDEAVAYILEKTSTELVETKGNVIVIYRRGIENKKIVD